MPSCFVRGCSSRHVKKYMPVSLHVFPKDVALTEQWLIRFGYKRSVLEDLIFTVSTTRKEGGYRVCSRHFAPECFIQNGKKKTLKAGSMPTLELPVEEVFEHNYCLPSLSEDVITEHSRPTEVLQTSSTMIHSTHHRTKRKGLHILEKPSQSSIGIQCKLDEEQQFSYQASHTPPSNVLMETLAFPEPDQNVKVKIKILNPISASDSHEDFDAFETPMKQRKLDENYRPTLKEEDEYEFEIEGKEDVFSDPNDLDKSYVLMPNIPESDDCVNENKFMVFESCLDALLLSTTCKGRSGCNAKVVRIKKYKIGSAISVTGLCSNKHTFFLWRSQPFIGRMPVGNLLISSSIVCTGSNYLNVKSFFDALGLYGIAKSTHYENQIKYIFPTVNHHWELERTKNVNGLAGAAVSLSGDGQFDSSNNGAKYCTYSLLENKTNKILDFQIEEQHSETSAVALECKALQICLDRLLRENVRVKHLCTDRHVSIKKTMKTNYFHIKHQFDVWRIAKSLGAKLNTASKRSNMTALADWVGPAKKHLWWSARSCKQNPKLLREQWSSIVYHVANKHSWDNGQFYHQCNHPSLTEEQVTDHKWLSLGTPAHMKLKEIVLNPSLLKDLEQLSFFGHTGQLHIFHRTALKYRSKCFNYCCIDETVARTQLAALEHNSNVGRNQDKVPRNYIPSENTQVLHPKCMFPKQNRGWEEELEFKKTNLFIYEIMGDVLQVAKGNKICQWQSRLAQKRKSKELC